MNHFSPHSVSICYRSAAVFSLGYFLSAGLNAFGRIIEINMNEMELLDGAR